MAFIAQLEPDLLIQHFIDQPPDGFSAARTSAGTPCFVAPFDLLTTADASLARRIRGLPFYRWWRGCLQWRTRFVGSTVSEFAPLSADIGPADLALALKRSFGRECRLLIVKDVAAQSPLLSDSDNAYARDFFAACEAEGFVLVEGQALAWVAIDFKDEVDYLSRLSSARRKDIRRKLRVRAQLQIDMLRTGDTRFMDQKLLDEYYALFENVYAQSEIHFDHPRREFFAAVLNDASSEGVVFTYRWQGELIGWNLCYVHEGKLVDKYVGFAYPQARACNLYFVSWMHNLNYAKKRGLSHYVAGWTDPAIKAYLGASFSLTRHAVYARNAGLRMMLRRLGHHFESDRQALESSASRV